MTYTSVHYETSIDLCQFDYSSSPAPVTDNRTIHIFHYDVFENIVVHDSTQLFSFPITTLLTYHEFIPATDLPPLVYEEALRLLNLQQYIHNGDLHSSVGVDIISTQYCMKRTVYDYNEYVTILLQGERWGPLPASTEAMCALKREGWNEDDQSAQCTTCSICLDDFQDGLEVTHMPCNHMFHEDCIIEWLKENRLCPLCRSPLPHIVDT
ncbi:hypothetical protein ACFE04_003726 [Oxalis oulophora]